MTDGEISLMGRELSEDLRALGYIDSLGLS